MEGQVIEDVVSKRSWMNSNVQWEQVANMFVIHVAGLDNIQLEVTLTNREG